MKQDPFRAIRVEEQIHLLGILEKRLPLSSHVYNIALQLEQFRKEISCFTLNKDTREDYGQDINISLPTTFLLTDEIKDAFINTTVIEWKQPHTFTAVDRRLSRELIKISVRTFKNVVGTIPVNYYYMSKEKACQIEITSKSDENLSKLDEKEGIKFLVSNWKYSKSGTHVYYRKIIANNPTSGVYSEEGKVITAATMQGHGIIGGLVTPVEHRRKGYANKCMQFLLREMGENGFIPVSTTGKENINSNALHTKLGMEVVNDVDYIFHLALFSAIV